MKSEKNLELMLKAISGVLNKPKYQIEHQAGLLADSLLSFDTRKIPEYKQLLVAYESYISAAKKQFIKMYKRRK